MESTLVVQITIQLREPELGGPHLGQRVCTLMVGSMVERGGFEEVLWEPDLKSARVRS